MKGFGLCCGFFVSYPLSLSLFFYRIYNYVKELRNDRKKFLENKKIKNFKKKIFGGKSLRENICLDLCPGFSQQSHEVHI